MSVINATPLLAAAGGDYQISRSVRLRSSASAYFNRTPGSASNRKTWTWSGWHKRGALQDTWLLGADDGTLYSQIQLLGDYLRFGHVPNTGGTVYGWRTQAVFRDPSAWYHIVFAIDTTQATAANRIRIYVNGVEQTSLVDATGYGAIPQNTDTFINAALSHMVGRFIRGANNQMDGYLTEVNFIDGQALTPSSFGETDAVTGVWKPKKYTGTYGTNGFYLNFSDNSAATAAAIGKDYSGNGNNWTPNNISVTAGVTYDSMLDVPTLYADGGNGRGNYAVVNPLSKGTSQTSVIDGNLYAIPISGASNWGTVFSSIAIPTSGKWYIEATAQVYAGSGNSSSFGVVDSTAFIPTNSAILYTFTTGEGFDGILAHLFSDYVSPISDGVQGTNVTGLTGTSINLMLALDVDNGKVYAGYNGTWLNSGNPAGGTGEVASRTFSANDVVAGHTSWNGTNDQSQYYNFGQRPFAYTPPTGFKALNTQNLPAPTILKGNQFFDALTWTGSNTSGSGTVTGLGFQPDFLWSKTRNIGYNHQFVDSVRGVGRALASNLTAAEVNQDASGYITSFNSNGFSSAAGGTGNYYYNETSRPYVAWAWKANGSAVTNTSGSITSQVNAGTSQGFSVVTYTGTGANATVGHGLGVAPKMVIIKSRTATSGWTTYFHTLGAGNFVSLNSTAGSTASVFPFNNTAPTSSVFSIGVTGNGTNNTGATYVAYCFSEVAGFSRFGSYTGNGSADGPFVFCGFRPRFVMIKRTDSTGDWFVFDTARNTVNTMSSFLRPNWSDAEATNTNHSIDFLSNGFKSRAIDTGVNASGGTFIYMAFAESPFRTSLAR